MKNWPSIDDFANASKNGATAILVDCVKNGSLFEWLTYAVSYIPYSGILPAEKDGAKKPNRAQLMSLGKSLGVHGSWGWFEEKYKQLKEKQEETVEKEIENKWHQTLLLQIPDTHFVFKDMIPRTRKELVLLRKIIDRKTPGSN